MPLVGRLPVVIGLLFTGACASAERPPQTPANLQPAKSTSEDAYVDPTESVQPIALSPLFDASLARSSFPSPTVGNLGCSGQAAPTGDHARDYESLAAACGAPTGLREYTKAFSGQLHHAHDQRDEYRVHLPAGFCFRVLAASDATVFDLGVRLLGPNGEPIAADATASSIAVAGDEPVCVADEGDYQVVVELNGPGFGGYTFGLWGRPRATIAIAERPLRSLP
jgi:hypothetical protein